MYTSIQGEEVPVIGMGTNKLTGSDCYKGVQDALSIGYRHIDTAASYKNEEEVGRAIMTSDVPREEIFLTTKIWIGESTKKDVLRKAEDSLRRLDADYVDLLLIHWPTHDMDLGGALEVMLELQEAERVRHLGVSNFTPELLHEAMEYAPLFSNQVEYHPYLAQDELVALAQKYDILLTAYAPVATGLVLKDPLLIEIGQKYGKSAAQISLRWLIQQEKVAAIPKASSPEHRRSNLDIFDFSLTEEEMDRIGSLARNERTVDPEFAPW